MEKRNFVPKIRFLKFKSRIYKEKLENIADHVTSYRKLRRRAEVSHYTGYRCANYYGITGNRLSNVITTVDILPNILPGKYKRLKKGDVFITNAAFNYKRLALVNIFLANSEDFICGGDHLIVVRPQKILPRFLYYTFESPDFRAFVHKSMNGIIVKHIYVKELFGYKLSLPKKEEQEAITYFFEKIDKIIQLHRRKAKHLEAMSRLISELEGKLTL